MTKLLLNQTQVVPAGPVKLAGIGMPETVNRIMRWQAGSGCCSFEGLFQSPRAHVAVSVAGQNQRVAKTSRLVYSLLPEKILLVVTLESADQ